MADQQDSVQLEQGNYEIIRKRLQQHGKVLQERLNALNLVRKEVFGNIEFSLKSTDRIQTANNCQAADIVALEKICLFGYNVHIGLRAEVKVEDVFSAYAFNGEHFDAGSIEFIKKPEFDSDFQNLYRYYRNTVFRRFILQNGFLYMLFQTSDKSYDLKAFKWLINGDSLDYIDDRSFHEIKEAPQHEFRWKKAGHENYRKGRFPHVSILDRVFVETTGGDLTIKIENNTDSGEGLYAEEVDQKDQTLDDAEFAYADLGNLIALRIKPYQEKARHYVYNEKAQAVRRIETLKDSAVLLPDNHGILFPDGYYLQTGDFKRFDHGLKNLRFERRISSPNGEDILYVFHDEDRDYLLLSYNVINQEIATPISCNGFTVFEKGQLCYFKAENQATKHHMIQIWDTPFMKLEFLPQGNTDNYLFKVGNKEIVKGMAESNELLVLLQKDDSYSMLYSELVKRSTDLVDSYYWLDQEDAKQLAAPIKEIRNTANAAIDEYEKVRKLRAQAQHQIQELNASSKELFKRCKSGYFESINDFVEAIAALRKLRGSLISAKETRYINIGQIETLEASTGQITEELSQKCVAFLLKEESLAPYEKRIAESNAAINKCETAKQSQELLENFNQLASELEMLIEVVSNLKIEDATQSTRIIEQISAIFGQLNSSKARLKKHEKSLRGTEAVAEFGAQLKLVDQAVVSYLDICESPKNCEDYLTRVMVQLEELEGRFADYEEFTAPLAEKREEIYSIFETRKIALLEKQNRRATSLELAADRILKGISNRSLQLKEVDEINSYFASDLMIEKTREIIQQLRDLNDTVKAEDIESRLKAIKDESIRQQKDKKDLFVEGEDVIKLGKHRFYVNTQSLDLTIVHKNKELFYHITGTAFFEQIEDARLRELRNYWDWQIPSENKNVYRAEFLSYQFYQKWKNDFDLQEELYLLEEENLKKRLLREVQIIMEQKFHEGYSKGVHDVDAIKILLPLLSLARELKVLSFAPQQRSLGRFYWQFHTNPNKEKLKDQIKGTGLLLKSFPNAPAATILMEHLGKELKAFQEQEKLLPEATPRLSAAYLIEELSNDEEFQLSQESIQLKNAFIAHLDKRKALRTFARSLASLEAHPAAQFQLLHEWLEAFTQQEAKSEWSFFIPEAALEIQSRKFKNSKENRQLSEIVISDFLGEHPQFENGEWKVNLSSFLDKMHHFSTYESPRFTEYLELKKACNRTRKEELRLSEFEPRILSSFVRNQLIDELYLPLFGDNLAKQIGTAGSDKRADRMGLLLLISPPGYGKTTLMEYVANRLGLIFVKINGPAIGHSVTSIDPSAADNAAAKEELHRLNLALEMGDNIMLYLDDIQHCHPEFLQKFISLCDAQRKIEGVFKGRSKTYDLKGKRVCVVMAGNPYTESGEKFQIPDMLANRADIYNLGDIIGDNLEAFKLSYLENAASSNSSLARLAGKNREDFIALIKIAETGNRDANELKGNHLPEELEEYLSVIKKALAVRDVILKVNQAYIKSAAQADEYRTEPPFRLQGSYRDMNKMIEKIVPIMNERELQSMIVSHYENESQTLTSGAESNFLKFKELHGILEGEELNRWEDIKATFQQKNKTGSSPEERMAQVISEMRQYSQEMLQMIEKKLDK